MWIEKHGPNWRIRDEIAGKKVTIKSGLPNKTVATTVLNTMRVDRLRGTFVNPQSAKIKLNVFIESFWPRYEITIKPGSRRSEWSRVKTHILPQLGKYRLEQIDAALIADFVATLVNGIPDPDEDGCYLRKPLKPKTVRNVHGILHRILAGAVKEKMMPANPASGTKMPPREHIEMMFLTPPEIERLLATCSGQWAHWRPLVMLLVTTGLRYGEALALRVGKTDPFARTVTVVETAYEAGGGEYIYTTPKTRQSRRTASMTQELALELAPLLAGKKRGDLVFTMPDGRPVTRNFRQRTWVNIREAAGLDGLRLHDLRHTVAALLISAGVPLTAVQRMLGHSSIKVTSDLYGHLMPEVNESIVATISGVLNRGEPMGGPWGDSTAGNGYQRLRTGVERLV